MLGSNMTDLSAHLSWLFVRLLFIGRGYTCGSRESLLRFEYKKLSSGRGEERGLESTLSVCKYGPNSFLQKVENNLHSDPAELRIIAAGRLAGESDRAAGANHIAGNQLRSISIRRANVGLAHNWSTLADEPSIAKSSGKGLLRF